MCPAFEGGDGSVPVFAFVVIDAGVGVAGACAEYRVEGAGKLVGGGGDGFSGPQLSLFAAEEGAEGRLAAM